MATVKKTVKKATKKKAAKKTTPKKAPIKKKVALKKASTKKNTPKSVTAPTLTKGEGTLKAPLMATLLLGQLYTVKGANPRSQSGPTLELAATIKQEGLLSSLVVRPGSKGKYEVVAGERRFRALTDLNWKHPIPCQVRLDLLGDDMRALSVAVAENSGDARTALSSLDVGRACLKLEKADWSIARIAKATGHHPQRVRRVLHLIKSPEDLQKKVRDGLSDRAALEILKVPEEQRAAVMSQVTSDTSAAEVNKMRKVAVNQLAAKKAAEGGAGKPAKKKAAPLVTSWRGAREKQTALSALAHKFVETLDNEIGTLAKDESHSADLYEYRGALAWVLWDRGDLESPYLPSDESDDPAAVVTNKQFVVMARNAATRHED